MTQEWPQENELRALPLLERLWHAKQAALVEDKESIQLAIDRIKELEAAVATLCQKDGLRKSTEPIHEAVAKIMNEPFE